MGERLKERQSELVAGYERRREEIRLELVRQRTLALEIMGDVNQLKTNFFNAYQDVARSVETGLHHLATPANHAQEIASKIDDHLALD